MRSIFPEGYLDGLSKHRTTATLVRRLEKLGYNVDLEATVT